MAVGAASYVDGAIIKAKVSAAKRQHFKACAAIAICANRTRVAFNTVAYQRVVKAFAAEAVVEAGGRF